MRKREMEELQRLEKALMELEEEPEVRKTPEPEAEEPDFAAQETTVVYDSWHQLTDSDYDVYSGDQTDVDLESYSEEVYQGSGRSNLVSGMLTIIVMLLLAAAILCMLYYLGVLR